MTRPTTTERNTTMLEVDTCDCCGSKLEGEAHFVAGKTWGAPCWSGRRPLKGVMPPTPHQRAQIAAWIAPRTGTLPAQLAFATRELVQPGEVSRG
jgi:hypothetical protein